MARRKAKNPLGDPFTLATAVIGGATALYGTIWGASQKQDQLDAAMKAERLKQIKLDAQRKEMLEQAAEIERQKQAQDAAKSAKTQQTLLIGGAVGLGILVGGFFLMKAMKKGRR